MSTNPAPTAKETTPPRSTPSKLVITIDLSDCVLPADFNALATLVGGFVEGTRQLVKAKFPGAIGSLNMSDDTDWLLQRFYAQLTSEGHRQSKAIGEGLLSSGTTISSATAEAASQPQPGASPQSSEPH